jgi:hypothetical protein
LQNTNILSIRNIRKVGGRIKIDRKIAEIFSYLSEGKKDK